MTPAPPGVVCVGGAVVDRHLHLHAPPVLATSNPARGSSSPGGVARNVAENLALLGVPVRLVSRVGDDDAGRELLAGLAGRGVDASGVRVVPGAATAQYVAVLDPDGELVLGVAAMDVLDGLAPTDVEAAWPPGSAPGSELGSPGSTWLLLDCNLPAAVLAGALRRAAWDGTRIAVEAVSTPKVVRLADRAPGVAGPPLAGVAVLFGNLDEAFALAGALGLPVPGAGGDGGAEGGAEGLALALVAAGAEAVVVTLGARGAVVADGAGARAVPGRPAHVVDVTGAGDALVAVTLAALVAGAPLDDAVRAGTEAAAATVESPRSVVPRPS